MKANHWTLAVQDTASSGQAFPRFYFMSSANLLDVLSNGSSKPRLRSCVVAFEHLTKGPAWWRNMLSTVELLLR